MPPASSLTRNAAFANCSRVMADPRQPASSSRGRRSDRVLPFVRNERLRLPSGEGPAVRSAAPAEPDIEAALGEEPEGFLRAHIARFISIEEERHLPVSEGLRPALHLRDLLRGYLIRQEGDGRHLDRIEAEDATMTSAPRSASGRQRFNVLGAWNAITRQLFAVTNTTVVNTETMCELLRRIAAEQLTGPITVVLDNARYQRNKVVQGLAAELGIRLLFLPPYSPNLNLIERLWGFAKRQSVYGKYHANFASF